MTESSDTSDTPDKPQNYAGLRAELATLVDDFSPPHQRALASPGRAQVPMGIASLGSLRSRLGCCDGLAPVGRLLRWEGDRWLTDFATRLRS
jgi:hypothetical protein